MFTRPNCGATFRLPARPDLSIAGNSTPRGGNVKLFVPRLAALPVLAALALLVVGSQAGAGAPLNRYIIQLSDSPLASYRGGVPGLAPTNPAALGAVKLDPASAASRAYLDYLQRQQSAFRSTLARSLGRTVAVPFTYRYRTTGSPPSSPRTRRRSSHSCPAWCTSRRSRPSTSRPTSAPPGSERARSGTAAPRAEPAPLWVRASSSATSTPGSITTIRRSPRPAATATRSAIRAAPSTAPALRSPAH